jgi:hypothetical protein
MKPSNFKTKIPSSTIEFITVFKVAVARIGSRKVLYYRLGDENPGTISRSVASKVLEDTNQWMKDNDFDLYQHCFIQENKVARES